MEKNKNNNYIEKSVLASLFPSRQLYYYYLLFLTIFIFAYILLVLIKILDSSVVDKTLIYDTAVSPFAVGFSELILFFLMVHSFIYCVLLKYSYNERYLVTNFKRYFCCFFEYYSIIPVIIYFNLYIKVEINYKIILLLCVLIVVIFVLYVTKFPEFKTECLRLSSFLIYCLIQGLLGSQTPEMVLLLCFSLFLVIVVLPPIVEKEFLVLKESDLLLFFADIILIYTLHPYFFTLSYLFLAVYLPLIIKSYFGVFFAISFLLLVIIVLTISNTLYIKLLKDCDFALKFLESLELETQVNLAHNFSILYAKEESLRFENPFQEFLAPGWFVNSFLIHRRQEFSKYASFLKNDTLECFNLNEDSYLKLEGTQVLVKALNYLIITGSFDSFFKTEYQRAVKIFSDYPEEEAQLFAKLLEKNLTILDILLEKNYDFFAKVKGDFLTKNCQLNLVGLGFFNRYRSLQAYGLVINLFLEYYI